MSDESASPLASLADFAVGLDPACVPAGVRALPLRGVMDMIGVTLAGIVQPQMAPLLGYVSRTYAPGDCTALGIPTRMTAEAAAYVNGAAAHVLDFDDCGDALGGHPTVPVLPAVLAVAEETRTPSEDALTAYVVGVEVENAIGLCLNYRHYERGWHPTATLGIFGAAAASARLLGADRETAQRALAIAASMSSGIKGNFGTFMKAGQVGAATSKGIAAARLAAGGVTANRDVFSGQHSFPKVFNGDETVDWSSLAELGSRWTMESPGLVFKLHPCCGSTHAAIDAALGMRFDGEIDPATTESIDIYLHPRRLPHIDRPYPRTGLAAKFQPPVRHQPRCPSWCGPRR